MVFIQPYSHALGNLNIARVAPGPPLDFLHHSSHRARLSMHRAGGPVELPQCINHRAPNPNPRVRLKARTAVGGVVGRRLEQTQHPGLNQIVDLHRWGQSARQVIGNPLHQLGVLQHQPIRLARRTARAVGARRVHSTASSRATFLRTSRSTKNSMLPRGPAGTGHVSARAANFLNARDAADDGYASYTGRCSRTERRRYSSSGISPANSSTTSRNRAVTSSKRRNNSAPAPCMRTWLASTRKRLTP